MALDPDMSEPQKQTQRVTGDDVKRVAELAYLELSANEETRMQRDLNAILDYVAQLNELDTSSVEPMAQVAEILGGASSALRADTPVPSLPRENVMVSAPETDGSFFKVPKVIER
jgi:aspartyl-tRNA(Asn)/glutamyl-tRNA(Gln) amidotransferase subunit C